MKRLTVLFLSCILGISSLTACGTELKSAKEPPKVEEEEVITQDTFENGVFTTDNYVVTINKSGIADKNKLLIEYTVENKSDENISPDKIWGYNLKILQYDEPLVLSRLANDEAEAVEEDTSALHEEVKPGESINGTLVFELPYGKEDVDVTVEALDTKSNKLVGTFVLDKDEIVIEVNDTDASESKNTKPAEEESSDTVHTGADDALDSTQKEIEESEE